MPNCARIVLDRMVAEGYIDTESALVAKGEPSTAVAPFEIRAPHFVMLVRMLLEQELLAGAPAGRRPEIHTTLDVDLNEAARDLLRHRLAMMAGNRRDSLSARRLQRQERGHCAFALHGRGDCHGFQGPDYFSPRIDGAVNATTALRQPDLLIANHLCSGACDGDDASHRHDGCTDFIRDAGGHVLCPLNYDLTYRGPVRLREALASSYNVVAVKVLDTIGVEAMTQAARRWASSFDDPDRLGLAVTLGGGEVSLRAQFSVCCARKRWICG